LHEAVLPREKLLLYFQTFDKDQPGAVAKGTHASEAPQIIRTTRAGKLSKRMTQITLLPNSGVNIAHD
jgi:hypothetical protein